MLTDDLFNKVLIQPVTEHRVDTLNIISGYASPSMVNRHFSELSSLDLDVSVNLIIGMTRSDGILESKHLAFLKAVETFNFSCRYISVGNPIHAKVYTWLKSEVPKLAFAGSANYSVTGFSSTQKEVLSRCDSNSAQQFFNSVYRDTVLCTEQDIKSRVAFTDSTVSRPAATQDSIELSLLDSRTGETHKKAGLNWGQREGRNSDQAYIPIPSRIYNTGFFPPIGERFTVRTDDGEDLLLVRAQERGKALHTSQDNSLLGLYFRSRIGVASGEYVTREHLEEYGRTTVSMSKLSYDRFLLNFSVNP